MSSQDRLQQAIIDQGNVVRKLKEDKADKKIIDEEVGILLALKDQVNTGRPSSPAKQTRLKCPKGTQDFGSRQMAIRQRVFGLITDVFRRHGAETIDTPVFEFTEVLLGKYGEEGGKLVYNLEDQGGELLSLRYDLTVPFARYLAMNKIKTLKRYHIAKVYRRDNPSMTKGRFREFYQCDFDIAGQYDPLLPESECLRIVDEVLTSLDIGKFTINLNHRLLLNGMFAAAGIRNDQFKTICSSVDKLDKSPWSEVREEMIKEKGLDPNVADKLHTWITAENPTVDSFLKDPLLAANKEAVKGLEELAKLEGYLGLLNCKDHVQFTPSLARGLDYYTGTIYEATVDGYTYGENGEDGGNEGDEPAVGSIAGGGRYDNLVENFAKGHKVPCCGVSLGIERIFAIMEQKLKKEKNEIRSKHTEVYVASAHKGLLEERLKVIQQLWDADIKAEMPYKSNPKLLDQLQFCEDNGIPLAIIIGGSELERGVLKLRNIKSRDEPEIPVDQLIDEIKTRLKS